MAANYEKTLYYNGSQTELEQLVSEAVKNYLRENPRVSKIIQSSEFISLQTPFNFWKSYGEILTVSVEENLYKVESRSLYPLAIFGLGINRDNVEKLCKFIEDEISRQPIKI